MIMKKYLILLLLSSPCVTIKAQKLEELVAMARAQLDSNHFYEAFKMLQLRGAKERDGSKNDGIIRAEQANVLDKGRLYGWYRGMYDYPPAPGVDTAKMSDEQDKDWEGHMETFCRMAVRDANKYGLGYEMRASLEISRKEFDKAAQDLAKAMELDPNNCHINYTKGKWYSGQLKWDSTVASFTKYIECDQRNYAAYMRRSVAYANLQQFDLAERDINEALRLNQRSKDVYIAITYIEHTKAIADPTHALAGLNKALALAKQNLQRYPGNEPMLKQLDEIYLNRVRVRSAAAKALVSAIYKKDNKAALAAIAGITDKNDLDIDFPHPDLHRKEDRPLTFAVSTNNYELAEALLKAGANPDVTSDRKETSLFSLGWKYDWTESDILKMSRLLFLYNANPNVQDEQGRTALYGALTYERIIYVMELINHKIDLNLRDNAGTTALSMIRNGTQTGFIAMKVLTEAGADVNIINHRKDVGPFLNAAYTSPYSLCSVYLLVKAGAKEIYPSRVSNQVLDPFIRLLKEEVIGKPAAQLFETMILQKQAKFKEVLKKVNPSDSLINYLYIANMGGPYNTAIDEELRHQGASDAFTMYSPSDGHSVNVASMKSTRFSQPKGDGYESFYYDELQTITELLKSADENLADLNRSRLAGTNKCTLIYDAYNDDIKVIRILNTILKNHDSGVYKISEKRKEEVNRMIATMKNTLANIKDGMASHGCSTNGLPVE